MKRGAKIASDPTTIERREFLGAGAAIGASAYLGSNESPGPRRARPRRATNCETVVSEIKWAIPQRHLNTLWAMVWPRVAARVWRGDFGWPLSSDADIGEDIQIWIESWVGRGKVVNQKSTLGQFKAAIGLLGADPGPNPSPYVGDFTQRFEDHLIELHRYLDRADRVPIFFLGEGGFDFVLSEEGLELWAPRAVPLDDPLNLLQPTVGRDGLLAAYGFRRAGRAPIAMGTVMDSEAPLPLLESPTGPGQIERVDPVVIADCVEEGAEVLAFCGVAEGAMAKLDYIQNPPARNRGRPIPSRGQFFVEREQPPEPRQQLSDLLESVGMPESVREDILRMFDNDDPDAYETARRWIQDTVEDLGVCTSLPPSVYDCHIVLHRCWVVSGSVYRGVLEQFPRVAADFWRADPGADVRSVNVREACEERMEAIFPKGMRFEFIDNPEGGGIVVTKPAALSADWDDEQLMITNAGFFFPKDIGATNGAGDRDGTAGTREELLSAIVEGRAGNPVFTDSSACV